MAYSYNKLKGRITELYGSQKGFSSVLGLSENSVSKKLNCKSGFSQDEIVRWAGLLNIKTEEYSEYFFA